MYELSNTYEPLMVTINRMEKERETRIREEYRKYKVSLRVHRSSLNNKRPEYRQINITGLPFIPTKNSRGMLILKSKNSNIYKLVTGNDGYAIWACHQNEDTITDFNKIWDALTKKGNVGYTAELEMRDYVPVK